MNVKNLSDAEAYEVIEQAELVLRTLARRQNQARWDAVRGSLCRISELAQHCLNAEKLNI
jgi:hypothetical protein